MKTTVTRIRRVSAVLVAAFVFSLSFAAVVPSGPAAAVPGGTWVEIVLNEQRAVVRYPDGAVMREFLISSGAGGKTPLGRYRIGRKSRTAVSSSNSAVTMAYMTRFNGGIGFHALPRLRGRVIATPLGIRAVSNGCIRMAEGDAKWIYDNLPSGTLVVVTRARTVASPPPAPTTTTTTLPPLPRRWSPVTTTTQPVLPRQWTPEVTPDSSGASPSTPEPPVDTTTTTQPTDAPQG